MGATQLTSTAIQICYLTENRLQRRVNGVISMLGG